MFNMERCRLGTTLYDTTYHSFGNKLRKYLNRIAERFHRFFGMADIGNPRQVVRLGDFELEAHQISHCFIEFRNWHSNADRHTPSNYESTTDGANSNSNPSTNEIMDRLLLSSMLFVSLLSRFKVLLGQWYDE